MEGPLAQYNSQHNHPTAIQPAQQSSSHAYTAQFPSQHLAQGASSGPTRPQATTGSQSSYSQAYRPAFAVSNYQHSVTPSTSSYSYKMPMGQSYPQQLSTYHVQAYIVVLILPRSDPRRGVLDAAKPEVRSRISCH